MIINKVVLEKGEFVKLEVVHDAGGRVEIEVQKSEISNSDDLESGPDAFPAAGTRMYTDLDGPSPNQLPVGNQEYFWLDVAILPVYRVPPMSISPLTWNPFTPQSVVPSGLLRDYQEQVARLEAQLNDRLNRLDREMQLQGQRLTTIESAYHRLFAAAQPRHGAVSSGSASPAPDILLGKIKALGQSQWNDVINSIIDQMGPMPHVERRLHRAEVEHALTMGMFNSGPTKSELECTIKELGKIYSGILAEKLKEELRALGGVCHQLKTEINDSDPRSCLFLPAASESFDPEKHELSTFSPQGDNAKIRYVMFPGYQTPSNVYLKAKVFLHSDT